MSATRYAVLSRRFAVSGGDTSWTNEIEYKHYGII